MEAETADVVLLADGLAHHRDKLYAILRGLHFAHPNTATVLLLDQYDRELVVNTLRAGARGLFCTALMPFKFLCRCITSVYQGQYWTNAEQLRFVLDSLSVSPLWHVTDSGGKCVLTPREEQTVRLVTEGLTNREIAREMKVKENTVKKSLLRIYARVGVSNRVELVLYALSHWQASSERTFSRTSGHNSQQAAPRHFLGSFQLTKSCTERNDLLLERADGSMAIAAKG